MGERCLLDGGVGDTGGAEQPLVVLDPDLVDAAVFAEHVMQLVIPGGRGSEGRGREGRTAPLREPIPASSGGGGGGREEGFLLDGPPHVLIM